MPPEEGEEETTIVVEDRTFDMDDIEVLDDSLGQDGLINIMTSSADEIDEVLEANGLFRTLLRLLQEESSPKTAAATAQKDEL